MTDVSPSLSRRERWTLLALLALWFAYGLFDHSLWSANDTREGAMIREMVREGVRVTPVFNGQHYLEKPPLLHWTGVALCRLAGTVNEGLVRLPAALYGFGALLILLRWSREMGRERAGFTAAFLCATSILYLEYSKVVLTDTALTFMVMLSLYLFWRAWSSGPGPAWRYGPFLLASAASFYAKGLLGPGFVWVSVCAFLAWRRQWKPLIGLPLVFLPVFALLVAPWAYALWKTGGTEMLRGVFWDNQFGRFLSFSDPGLPLDPYRVHKEPVYYYLVELPIRLLPWTLLVLPALWHWFRRSTPVRDPLSVFLRVAVISMAVILHLSSAKAACYALPLFPLLFLMTGLWLEDALRRWSWSAGSPARTRRLLDAPAAFAALLMLLGAIVIPIVDHHRTYKPFADLVRDEMTRGRAVALADSLPTRERCAMIFYADARMPVVAATNGTECAGFLFAGGRPAGLVVHTRDVPQVTNLLSGRAVGIVKSGHAGYKSEAFRLLIAGRPEEKP